jgi:polysaccharide biosynthesis protein PslG
VLRQAKGRLIAGIVALALTVSAVATSAGASAGAPTAAHPGASTAARTAAPKPAPAHAASAAVPSTFVGVDADGPMLDASTSRLSLARQFTNMVAAGVGSVRVAFDWAKAQPYQAMADVPAGQQSRFTDVGGVPTDFSQTDQFVELAAQRGLTLLPTILYAPSWDAVDNHKNGVDYPADPGPFAAYATALVDRYGPNGSFWASHPRVPRMPIRMWQIWNEENISYYWAQPFAPGYAALLHAAHDAIKAADPGAKVVLGALTNYAWQSIGQLNQVPGVRSWFDIASVNAFTKRPANVILYLKLMRRALDTIHDGRTPLIASELSWPSALGETPNAYDFDTTEAGQARNISELLPMLGANRRRLRLQSFYYYTWISVEIYGAQDFAFAGLLGQTSYGRVFTKPALAAFSRAALALEHCKRKSSNARRCAKPAR